MRRIGLTVALVGVLLLSVAGCGWLWRHPPQGLPDEILPGWEKEVEAPFYSDALPEGASGALGAVWRRGEAWLWVEVIAFPNPDQARAEYLAETSYLSDVPQSDLGDEGVTLVHPPSGLAIERLRVGADLVLVGSLAASPENAPPPERVRGAAERLIGLIPAIPPAQPSPPIEGTCTPPEESPYLKVLRVPLSLPDETENGTVTLVLKIVPKGGLTSGLCSYRLELYVKCIELGPEDGDPGT